MKPLLPWLLSFSLLTACGGGDPPRPQLAFDDFVPEDAAADAASADALLDVTEGPRPEVLDVVALDVPGELPSDAPSVDGLLLDAGEDLLPDADEDLLPDAGEDLIPDTAPVCDCDDGNPCTYDDCEPVTGQCLHEDAAIPCDDGNSCTTDDFCVNGVCTGMSVLACDDLNPCTDDSCDVLTGCVFVPNGTDCDDGEDCTLVDICVDGVCTGTDNVCLCTEDADCQPLQDYDLCNGSLVCTDGLCQFDPDTVIGCDDPDEDDCVEFECDPLTGECQGKAKPADESCDDHDVCTLLETCQAGLCVSDAVVDCNDGQVCTADLCDPEDGCLYAPSLAPCDDGDACTVDDTCTEGLACVGAPMDCDDGDVCTGDSCVSDTGCVFTAITCDDGDVCTDDSCDSLSGCVFTPNEKSCDDEDVCTSGDTCL